MRRFALSLLVATATSMVSAGQPGEARRNRAEAEIPPLPPLEHAAEQPVALAVAEELDDHAQVVELAAPVSAAMPIWSIDVVIGAATRCALGPSADCLANDARLRAAGIVLDPDDLDAPPAAVPGAAPAGAQAREAPAARPAHEPVAPPRLRAAALRAVTPDLVGAAAAPALAFPAPRRAAEPSGVVAPMQWRIGQATYVDLQPRTEVTLARGEAARTPTTPADGGPPIPGAARLRVGISVPLEAFRSQARPADAVPPPGIPAP